MSVRTSKASNRPLQSLPSKACPPKPALHRLPSTGCPPQATLESSGCASRHGSALVLVPSPQPPLESRLVTDTYLERVRKLCGGLGEDVAAAAAGARSSLPLKASVDCDTEVTQHSYAAAMRGAGAVVEAVRAVCATPREARAAFCAVRPPGHHAGPSGAQGGQSAGFCVLANAAIGAAYGLAVHRGVVGKVAIVDFDIHHGNGTEACVQAVVPTPWTVTHETPAGIVSSSGVTYQPWLGDQDKECIFFGSIHGYARTRGPPVQSLHAPSCHASSVSLHVISIHLPASRRVCGVQLP